MSRIVLFYRKHQRPSLILIFVLTSDVTSNFDLPLQTTNDILRVIVEREKYVRFSFYPSIWYYWWKESTEENSICYWSQHIQILFSFLKRTEWLVLISKVTVRHICRQTKGAVLTALPIFYCYHMKNNSYWFCLLDSH